VLANVCRCGRGVVVCAPAGQPPAAQRSEDRTGLPSVVAAQPPALTKYRKFSPTLRAGTTSVDGQCLTSLLEFVFVSRMRRAD
jgi:hypothetical protein